MNLNINQILAIILIVLGVLVASTAQLTDLFGPIAAKYIISASGLLVSILNGILTVISGQASQVKAVSNMPGVDKIIVNNKANTTLATLAVDPLETKINASPEAAREIQAIAKAG